ncbi:MAG: ATP-binding protein [Succinivibrionaceae bacterium]|nr:ATP-binding protein [Succinivibrionaceae bacterium]
MFGNVYPREKYLSKIRPFYDSDIIKVITGMRRCGKSFLLKGIINELLDAGHRQEEIVFLPLDQRGFKSISTPDQLEARIESMATGERFRYLIIDEVQNVKGFESVVLAYAEEGLSVFLTGSNSYLLSDEISTKLTGRYLPFEVYTLDFREYLEMKRFRDLQISQDLASEFDEYVAIGGLPKALEFPDLNSRQIYTREIIRQIFQKDIRTRKRISNLAVFERVQSFLLNNYASPFSLSNLLEVLRKEGLSTKAATVRGYIEELKKAKIVYECNRFDLKSKKAVRREQKYYLGDLSIFFATGTDNRISYGQALENMVYLYLASLGYQISVGKIGDLECDFIVRDPHQNYAYIQVTYTMQGEDLQATEKIRQREYRPFRHIRDGYPRYIVSLDRFRDQQEGVRHISAIDLFLGKETIGEI